MDPNPSDGRKFYISRKTQFAEIKDRCIQNIRDGYASEIHALGAAIPKAVSFALLIQSELNDIVYVHTNTSTCDITEDVEPDTDEAFFIDKVRKVSAIHIRFVKKPPFVPSPFK